MRSDVIRYTLMMILLLVSIVVCGQEQLLTHIRGRVVDQKGNSVTDGSLYLHSLKDSSILRGYNWSNGNLLVDSLPPADFLLEIKASGFSSYFKNIRIKGGDPTLDIGTIVLQPDMSNLKEVVVNGHAAAVTTTNGNIKIDVGNSTLGSSNSTFEELLLKLPGLTLGDQYISVLGKGNAIIYYDGRKVSLDQMKAIPIDRIGQIEIITNPSAKYDAQGNAVVNITSKKRFSEGLSGQLKQIVQQGQYFNETTGLSLNYDTKKLAFTGSLNQNTLNKGSTTLSNYNVTGNGFQYSGSSNNSTLIKSDFIPTYLAGIQYTIDPQNSLSFEYNGNNTIERQYFNTYNTTNSVNVQPNDTSFTANTLHSQWYNDSYSLNYDRKLDSLGTSIAFKGQYFNEAYNYSSAISQIVGKDNTSQFQISSPERIYIYSVQADYEKDFRNGSRLATGLNYSGTLVNSWNDFTSVDSPNSILSAEYSDHYKYHEYVPAAYAEYSGQLKSIQYTVGARGEYSDIWGYSYYNSTSVIDTTYFRLFPSVNLKKKVKSWSYGLSYSSRIFRPSYFDLAPYTQYDGPSTIVQTNPRLAPALINSVEAFTQFKDYSVKVGYSSTKNYISSFYQYNADGQVLVQKLNLNRQTEYYIGLSIPVSTTCFESSNVITVNFDKLSDPRFTGSRYGVVPLFDLYSINTFKIPGVFDIDLMGDYSSVQEDGLNRNGAHFYSELGLTKRNKKGNMTFRLSGQDIFNVYHVENALSYNSTELQSDRHFTLRLVKLSFTYHFGKLKRSRFSNSGAAEKSIDRS